MIMIYNFPYKPFFNGNPHDMVDQEIPMKNPWIGGSPKSQDTSILWFDLSKMVVEYHKEWGFMWILLGWDGIQAGWCVIGFNQHFWALKHQKQGGYYDWQIIY